MAGAKGKTVEFRPEQVEGLDSRVWQKEGTSTEMIGVVFTQAAEVIKAPGIQPLVEAWGSMSDPDTGPFTNPFDVRPVSIGTLYINGANEIVFQVGKKIRVLTGNTSKLVLNGVNQGSSPSNSMRFLQAGNTLLMLNGLDPNRKWDGIKVTPVGIANVPSPPYPVETEAGSRELDRISNTAGQYMSVDHSILRADDATTFYYKTTWVNEYGQESEPSRASIGVSDEQVPTAAPDNRFLVYVANLAGEPPSDDIVGRYLYRSNDDINYHELIYLSGVSTDTYFDYAEPETSFAREISKPGTNLPPPVSTWAFNFRGRTYYGGAPEGPNVLYYGEAGGGKEAVSADNYFIVQGEGEGDPITGWGVSGDYALIFTARSTHMLTHDKNNEPILTPVSKSVGAVSDRAVVTYGDRLFIFSKDGIFGFDGSELQPVSREIASQVQQLPQSYLKNVFGWSDPSNRRVYFSLNSGPGQENNEVWAIHIDGGGITKLGFHVHGAVRYKGETLVLYSKFLPDGSPNGWDLGVWATGHSVSSSGAPYLGEFVSRWFFGKNPQADKTFSRLDIFYVQTSNVSMTVKWGTEWDRGYVGNTTFELSDPDALRWDATTTWADIAGTKTWDEQRVRCKRISLNGDSDEALTSKSIRFSFSTSQEDEPWRIVGYVLHYTDHGIRGEGTDE